MQDYQTENDDADVLENGKKGTAKDIVRNMLKKIVTFVCFGPGVLGVLWIFGRIFKR